MPARRTGEAHRALEQLEEYHATLTRPSDDELRLAIERVIGVFKSNLFQALLGMWRYCQGAFCDLSVFANNFPVC